MPNECGSYICIEKEVGSTAEEVAEASTRCDEIYIKGEPMFPDFDVQPAEEIYQISIKEENDNWEIDQDQNECDPLQVKEEELEYEVESAIHGSERESSQVEHGISTDGCTTLPTRYEPNMEVDDCILSTDEWQELSRNNSGTKQPVPSCEKASAQLQSPEEHRHQGSSHLLLSCTECHKTFVMRCDLEKHVCWHNRQRSYSCAVCNKTFTSNSHLKRHSLLHTGEHPYSCSVCTKTFTKSYNLKRHLLQHTGHRPFSCSVCNKTFTQSGDLKRHSLQHTGQRPYSCSVCSKTFTQRGSLKKHSLLHTRERQYSCSVATRPSHRVVQLQCSNQTITKSGSLMEHLL